MIGATVTLTLNTGVSLYALIEAASTGQLRGGFNGRICEVVLQWVNGVSHVVWKAGTVNLAVDSGFALDTTTRILQLRAPTHNQLNLLDIYLAGAAGGENVRVTAYSV